MAKSAAKKSYIFIYDEKLGTREQLVDYLDGLDEIINWRYELPNCFFIVSRENADKLCELITKFSDNMENKERLFLISQYHRSNSQGWLLSEGWNFLNDKPSPDR